MSISAMSRLMIVLSLLACVALACSHQHKKKPKQIQCLTIQQTERGEAFLAPIQGACITIQLRRGCTVEAQQLFPNDDIDQYSIQDGIDVNNLYHFCYVSKGPRPAYRFEATTRCCYRTPSRRSNNKDKSKQ